MAATRVGELASEALLEHKEEIARAITKALYAEMPDLLEKYGERGRSKCLQDMRYNLEHLAPAVALGDPGLFARYVSWLRDMLGSRGIPADEVRRSLELTRDVVRAHMGDAEADAVGRALDAGLRALADEGSA